jgi:YggT family protein
MNPFIWLILTVLNIYFWVLIAMIVMSWLMAFNILSPSNPNVRQANYFLRRLTEPVLQPIRRVLPDLGGIDLSPLVLIIGLQFLQQFVAYYLPGLF